MEPAPIFSDLKPLYAKRFSFQRHILFHRFVFGAIFLLAALLYAALQPQYRTGTYNDDAAYLIAARSLLRTWHAAPGIVAHVDFPFPGLPLLLAPIVKVVQPHWNLVEWASSLCTFLSLFLFGKLLKQWFSSLQISVVVAAYALNPIIAHFSGILMPEPYFIVAILLSFLLLKEVLSDPSRLKAWLLGAVVGWGSLMRPESVILLVSISITLALVKRWADLTRMLAMSIGIWGFFILHQLSHAPSMPLEYGLDIKTLMIYWPAHLSDLFVFLGKFLNTFFIQTVLGIGLPQAPLFTLMGCLLILSCLVVIQSGFQSLWTEHRSERGILVAIAVFSFLYGAIHIAWHVDSPRYGLELLPLILPLFFSRPLRSLLEG